MKSFMFFNMVVVLVVLLCLLSGYASSKECTNTPTQLSSHTFRHELLSSNNETWKEEMFSHYHLTATDDSTWANLLPRKILKEEDEFNWMMMYRKMKHTSGGARDGLSGEFLNEVPLSDVRLDPESFHGQAQQTNLEYLLLLDVDSLVWSFRRTAGLPTVGQAYGGWEAPTQELRGHFVGHYLSASARMWASTGNDTLKEKMNAVISVLSECQDTMGTGYLSAFPTEFFDRFEAIKPVWAPYYTIHKIMAGLLDQYIFAANSLALKMATRMADYFYKRVQNVISQYSIERHWLSLNEETGGMNDVLYRLYTITGDTKHLLLAHLFDKPCFLGVLAIQADDIAGFHTNTHIPVVIGAQMRYEVTGDPLYKEMGMFFMDIVNSSHSYATGGTSVSEFWTSPKRLASTLGTENEESCTTYNMLKVSRHLFRWTKEMAYADYYERAMTNGVLGIQRRNEPGVMIYMLPLSHGVSKAISYHGWGTKFNSFWCCYGTGIESFSKLGDSIYFEEGAKGPAGLYIIQYISSSLDWKSGNITLNQKVEPAVSWDPRLQVTITITSKEEGGAPTSTLNFRIPSWTNSNGAKALLNGQSLPLPARGNFLSVTRKWSSSDKITFELPLTLRSEAIKDDRANYTSLHAILYGPYLLAGLTTDDWDIKADQSVSLSDLITPIPAEYNSRLISLSQKSGKSTFALAHSNNSIIMAKFPEPGTNTSVHATFRLLFRDDSKSKLSSVKDAIGKSVMLEPFDLPGKLLMQQGEDESLGIGEASTDSTDFTFRLVAGLDGNNGTVSLESEKQKGCYVYSDASSGGLVKHLGRKVKLSGGVVKLSCNSGESDVGFKEATSFVLSDGVSSYHPMSFVAKGLRRNFLLAPLFSITDEHYTVYFNFNS